MEDVIEGGIEEEVILPDAIPQGHGVEAALAAEHEKEIGGVGNAVPSHAVPGAGEPLTTTKLNADLPKSGDLVAKSNQSQGKSKISELLLSLTGRSKSEGAEADKADTALRDVERDPLLPAVDTADASQHAHLREKEQDNADQDAAGQTGLFSHHDENSHVERQTGLFSGTLTQFFAFGMPFVVICAGAVVVYQRRWRGLHGHHHHMPKV